MSSKAFKNTLKYLVNFATTDPISKLLKQVSLSESSILKNEEPFKKS